MEEDIEYLEQFIGIKKEYKYKPIKAKTLNNTRQAIENLIKGYKELEEQRDSLMWQRNTIDIPQIEALEEKINYINVEKDLLVLQLKQEKLYGNKVTIDLQNGSLPDILVKDYLPKSKVREIIYPTPENPISIEIQNSEMYKRLEKLMEGDK